MLALKDFLLILSGVILNAAAQICLKQGAISLHFNSLSLRSLFYAAQKVFTNLFILLGFSCYIFSVSIWIIVLSRVPISVAYPMLSIGYIITLFAGAMFFQEELSAIRLLGVGIITIGVYCVSR